MKKSESNFTPAHLAFRFRRFL